ncbi:MAG: glutamine-hydrolyzing GMP synthase [Oscillospiraceae bacterium]
MSKHSEELVIVLDFGGQYNQLIARRVRSNKVFCEVLSYKTPIDVIKAKKPKAIIFTGGPNSVHLEDSPKCSLDIFNLDIPILGICYGAQLISHMLGGKVNSANTSEYGKTETFFEESPLFNGMKKQSITWMSHTDKVTKLATNFKPIAKTKDCEFAAFSYDDKKIYGVQFHPEVLHSEDGFKVLSNFLFNISKCNGTWTMENYAKTAISEIKEQVKDKKVLLALSGGVDSSVAAALLSKAIKNQLTCVYIDHGLMRYNESDEIENFFNNMDLNFIKVNAQDRFIKKLEGITDPECKRKAIGEEFIRVFEEIGKEIKSVDFLAQGTIYPDIVESGNGDSAVIKSHHNVGGLPDNIDFTDIIEPLKMLFKDEVRDLGLSLDLPKEMVYRQPFPGPGLGIRIIGDVTKEKVDILQKADYIFREKIVQNNLDTDINQYFAVLTSVKTVGVKGDDRTYEYTLALRAVTTDDFMTADFAKIPYDVLENISVEIINKVKGINRIVYDITTKPPATIEWE